MTNKKVLNEVKKTNKVVAEKIGENKKVETVKSEENKKVEETKPKKMTNALALELVLGMKEVKENSELVEKLEKMKIQFEKKNGSGSSSSKKPTKTQLENEKIKNLILGALSLEGKQIKEIQKNPNLKEYSNQKLSALLRQMVKDNLCVRVEEKKTALFKLCEEPKKITVDEVK